MEENMDHHYSDDPLRIIFINNRSLFFSCAAKSFEAPGNGGEVENSF